MIQYIKCFFPVPLPRGKTELEEFTSSVLTTYNLPDKPSYRHAIATMILHLGPMETKKSKRFFALSIIKAQVNEVAYAKIQEIKEEEKKKIEIDASTPSESSSAQ